MTHKTKTRNKKYHPKPVQYCPAFLAKNLDVPTEDLERLKSEVETLVLRLRFGTADTACFDRIGRYFLLGSYAAERFSAEKDILESITAGLETLFKIESEYETGKEVVPTDIDILEDTLSLVYEIISKLNLQDFRVFAYIVEKEGAERLQRLKDDD